MRRWWRGVWLDVSFSSEEVCRGPRPFHHPSRFRLRSHGSSGGQVVLRMVPLPRFRGAGKSAQSALRSSASHAADRVDLGVEARQHHRQLFRPDARPVHGAERDAAPGLEGEQA